MPRGAHTKNICENVFRNFGVLVVGGWVGGWGWAVTTGWAGLAGWAGGPRQYNPAGWLSGADADELMPENVEFMCSGVPAVHFGRFRRKIFPRRFSDFGS